METFSGKSFQAFKKLYREKDKRETENVPPLGFLYFIRAPKAFSPGEKGTAQAVDEVEQRPAAAVMVSRGDGKVMSVPCGTDDVRRLRGE